MNQLIIMLPPDATSADAKIIAGNVPELLLCTDYKQGKTILRQKDGLTSLIINVEKKA